MRRVNCKELKPEGTFLKEENSQITIEERTEKKEESLACDLQPTNDNGEGKNQSPCGSPKEDEIMFTSSLPPYENVDKEESHIVPLCFHDDQEVEEYAIINKPLGDLKEENTYIFAQSSHKALACSYGIGAITFGSGNNEGYEYRDSSYMQGMTAHSEIDFPCPVHVELRTIYLLENYYIAATCLKD